ncbi:MAG: sulfur carrier protein ThiS [Eubacterium sp.]|nr:sulfur carrier protein ThiS [Eubacterium sp.]
MLKINGKEYDFAGRTVRDVITELGYEKNMIAVERNEEIIPKATYEEAILNDGDTVEVVSFVGGG